MLGAKLEAHVQLYSRPNRPSASNVLDRRGLQQTDSSHTFPLSRGYHKVQSNRFASFISRGNSRCRTRRSECRASASSEGDDGNNGNKGKLDSNQLQTALNNAIQSEDYAAAAQLSKKLKSSQGQSGDTVWDWRAFDCPHWLAERAEQMGFKFPTGMSKNFAFLIRCQVNGPQSSAILRVFDSLAILLETIYCH